LARLPQSAGVERREDSEAVVQDAADQRISSADDGRNRALGIALEHAHGLRGGDRDCCAMKPQFRALPASVRTRKCAAYICADLALECPLQLVELLPQCPLDDHPADLGTDAAENLAVHAGVEHHLLLHNA